MTTFDHSAPSRRSRWFAGVVLVAALMAGAAPVQATGTEGSSGAESSPAQIVVLGDSYSSGNGAGAYSDRPCMRSDLAYGPVAARQLGAEIPMAACGGGVLADLSQPRHLRWETSRTRSYWLPRSSYPTVADQAAEWQRRVEAEGLCGSAPEDRFYEYRRVAPAPAGSIYTATAACHLWAHPQIASVSDQTDHVFLTIGGNDGGFVDIVVQCFVLREAIGCERSLSVAEGRLGTIQDGLAAALRDIDRASSGTATIHLVAYPMLINRDSYTLPEGPAGWYDAGAELNRIQQDYTALQRETVERLNAETGSERFRLVDPTATFEGRGLDPRIGASQHHSWIVPPFSSLDIPGFMHPTATGHAQQAPLLVTSVLESTTTAG
ncbi:SGNH/GDSL hydrolase family protein [Micrococcus terreus]|uniref:SGNH/GDSL hydrolase family protein n=1 Tax=Micrococcus terreus TaxID=574650 RepID=UPI0034112A39